jgi:hypothetical protein
MINEITYSAFILKTIGILGVILIVYVTFLTVKYSQIEKFGGGPELSETVNKEINELKRKTIFKLITNFFIVVILAITLVGNILVPEAINNQITIAIYIAGITSLGIKLGFDLNGK